MKRKEIPVWIKMEDEATKEIFRKKVIGFSATIKGIPLIVHPSEGYTGGRDLWNCCDLYTGMKVGPRSLGMDLAIKETKKMLERIEKKNKEDKTLLDIFEEKRQKYGNIMDLPERKTT